MQYYFIPGYVTCPSGFKAAGIYCYSIRTTTGNFAAQKMACENTGNILIGGYLVKVGSSNEVTQLLNHFKGM